MHAECPAVADLNADRHVRHKAELDDRGQRCPDRGEQESHRLGRTSTAARRCRTRIGRGSRQKVPKYPMAVRARAIKAFGDPRSLSWELVRLVAGRREPADDADVSRETLITASVERGAGSGLLEERALSRD